MSLPLIYWNTIVFRGELLMFRQNLDNPAENDFKVKLAFLMALSIVADCRTNRQKTTDLHTDS